MNSDLLLSPLYKIKDEFFKRESISNLLQISSNENQFSRQSNRSFKVINHHHLHHCKHDLEKRDILRFKASTFNASNYSFNFMQVDNIVSFVDNLELAANRLIDKKNKLKIEIDLESSNKTLLDEQELGLSVHEDRFKISQAERESLYCELIYTIKHKIGRTIDGHNDYITDLYKYAQEVFKLSLEEHNRLVAQTNEEKPPIVILYVEIKEAKNLEAKDANGFSDPYCMLGIVPGSRLHRPQDQNSSDDDTVQNLPKLVSRNSVRSESIASPNSTSNKSSFMKRFSSFRRSQKADSSSSSSTNRSPSLSKSNTNNKKANNYTISKLPAKYIQTTDVKKETLNPVWNQKFRFQIDDINSDILHLDIWDHDDEASVFDAAKKLNEVKCLKGLDRYFKQIAQSARTKDVNVDDFLGSVNIQLNDLPSNGTEKWFDLEGRSEKSKVEGKIRLRLKLATREDRGLPEDDNSNDLKQQEQMLSLFIDHELNQLGAEKKSTDWNGKLSREAETILHQHAIQGDITDFQITMCRWIAYSKKHIEKELSLKLLLERLESLDKVWSSSSPSREEADMLRQSFTLFIDHCFNVITNLNEACRVTQNRAGLTKLEQIIKLLINIYNMNAFKYCFPFHNTLAHELILLLKNNFSDRLDFLKEKFLTKPENEDILKKLIKFTQIIYLDLYFANTFYTIIFEDLLNIQYFQMMYKKVDSYVSELIKKTLTDEFGDEINYGGQELVALITNTQLKMNALSLSSSSLSSNKTNDTKFGSNPTIENNLTSPLQSPKTVNPPNQINENTAIVLFELYSNVVLISNFKTSFNEYEFITAKANTYYETFYLPFKRWIEFVKKKIDIKIEKCLENDKNEPVLTEINKFSQSSVEVATCLTQASKFWKLVNWPGYLGSQCFLSDLTDHLSKAITSYANLIKAQTQLLIDSLTTETKEEKKLSIFQKVIINANNLEKIRDSFRAYQLEVENKPPEHPPSNSNNNNSNNRASTRRLSTTSKSGSDIEVKVSDTSTYLSHLIEILIGHIFDHKITAELESHLFYLFESPESSSAHESVSRLLQYLKTNLIVFKDIALKVNFERLLKSVWTKLLNTIETNIKKDNTRTTIFFSKMLEVLDILLNLFNLDNQGVAKDHLAQAEKYKYLKSYLKLQTMDTSRLIQLYYQDMISIQANLKTSEYGVIYCRAYYHSKDETLVIEVFKCKNLEPMDPNGLSDPYVEIELKPRHLFGGEKKLTSVIKKTLNPIFNEVLEFKISEKMCLQRGNVINFTVMDHDLVWSNDFEGEAFLELSTLPGIRNDLGEGGYKDLKYVELQLIRPKNYPNQILDALEYRVQDKLAIEFLKERRDKLKN